jgi:hypothetical protein
VQAAVADLVAAWMASAISSIFTAQFPELQKRQQARAQREAEENY